MNRNDCTVVVIGGGIAGISCIETLIQDFDKVESRYRCIVLISESRLIKRVANYELRGRQLERFDVTESESDELLSLVPDGLQLRFVVGSVQFIDHDLRVVGYVSKREALQKTEPYDILCVCSGSRPRQLGSRFSREINERILVIRDTHSVEELEKRLSSCRRLVILGNGGISLELVAKISKCEKIWIVRDESIGSIFLDIGAGKFLLDSLDSPSERRSGDARLGRYPTFSVEERDLKSGFGPSLGPNWSLHCALEGSCRESEGLRIIYQDELSDITISNCDINPLLVRTKKGVHVSCDLIVTAIGVIPNVITSVGRRELLKSKEDGGILIDDQMQTSLDGVYAAGDVTSCEKWPINELWFQMRLWTQAKQMGHYTGKCIDSHLLGQDPRLYFNFECFTHCTSFFGFKVVLLGKHNKPADHSHIIVRVNAKEDYVKLILNDEGRIVGATLVGDSGLEETIENLIHNRIDVSPYKEQLLDNTVDIEDYFD